MEHLVEIKSQRGNVLESHSIYFNVDQPNTLASLILLKNDYLLQDERNKRSYCYRRKMIEFSRGYLTSVQNKFKTLYCTYCGKPDLTIELEGMKVNHKKMATIDHIDPISKGGALVDPKNVTCCCGKCNGEKSNKDVLTFLRY